MAVSLRAALLAALGVVAVALSPSTAMAWGWLGLIAVVCVLDAVAAVSPRDLEVSRAVSAAVRADETAESALVLRNPGRRGVRADVRDAWPPSVHPSPARHRVRLPGGGSERVVTRLRPERRGTRTADYVSLRVWGPLGLGARQVSVAATVRVAVLPEFRSRRLLPSRLARLREEGATATILRGPGTEFDSLRDYVRGDDPRDIDWRASARARDLVVRTWRPERDRHVVMVLDTGRSGALLLGAGAAEAPAAPVSRGRDGASPSASPDLVDLGVAPRMDAGIEAALLLAALADRAGDNVHLLAVDRSVRARVSGVRGAPLLHHVAEALTDVSPTLQPIDWPLAVAEVRRTVHHPGLVVLLTEVPPVGADPDFLQAVADLSDRHTVIVASAADPEVVRLAQGRRDADAVYQAAAASSTLREQAAGDEDAARAGAIVLDVEAGLLPARLSDTYLQLKKQGRL